tara:strand:+ start:618 stop:920 length:303 start_codon:yes stop_codon:yes gene_type:complete
MSKLFKREFLFWWTGLFLLNLLGVASNTKHMIGWKIKDVSLTYGLSFLFSYAFISLFFLFVFALSLYAIVGLVSKRWEGQVFMIIITALTIFVYLGYLGF